MMATATHQIEPPRDQQQTQPTLRGQQQDEVFAESNKDAQQALPKLPAIQGA